MSYLRYILSIAAVITLFSCSHDEVIVQKQNEITFAVRTQSASRGEVITTNGINRDGEKFSVWAYYRTAATASQQPYMNEILTHNGTEWALDATRYWPQAGFMDFYCVYPINSKNEANAGTLGNGNAAFDYSVSTDLAKQDDLLYATAIDETRGITGVTPVQLNFRHALSQIVYQVGLNAKTDVELPLEVTIKAITLTGIDGKATLSMPTESTNVPDYSSNTNGDEDTEINDSWGEWRGVKEAGFAPLEYKADVVQTVQNSVSTATATYASGTFLDYGTTENAMLLLLPQGLEGAKLNVYCTIKTKAADGSTDIVLQDATTTPLTHTFTGADAWKQGKKYVYKIKFGATLQAIKFSVTVDEYQLGAQEEIEV